MTAKMKNKIRAMSAVAADIPVNPNKAATIEIKKNINAHFSNDMIGSFAAGQLKDGALVPTGNERERSLLPFGPHRP
jgi:hypothetical protein